MYPWVIHYFSFQVGHFVLIKCLFNTSKYTFLHYLVTTSPQNCLMVSLSIIITLFGPCVISLSLQCTPKYIPLFQIEFRLWFPFLVISNNPPITLPPAPSHVTFPPIMLPPAPSHVTFPQITLPPAPSHVTFPLSSPFISCSSHNQHLIFTLLNFTVPSIFLLLVSHNRLICHVIQSSIQAVQIASCHPLSLAQFLSVYPVFHHPLSLTIITVSVSFIIILSFSISHYPKH